MRLTLAPQEKPAPLISGETATAAATAVRLRVRIQGPEMPVATAPGATAGAAAARIGIPSGTDRTGHLGLTVKVSGQIAQNRFDQSRFGRSQFVLRLGSQTARPRRWRKPARGIRIRTRCPC